MANTHEVTVYIWRGDPKFEASIDAKNAGGGRIDVPDDHFGHVAIKLQEIGCDTGDYYYLSFNPGDMPARKGPKALEAIELQDKPKLFHNQDTDLHDLQKQGYAITKKFDVNVKPDVSYRFHGLAFDLMVKFAEQFAKNQTFSIFKNNCAHAAAACLNAGAAPDMPKHENWTPNRVEAWCEQLHSGTTLKDSEKKVLKQ